MTFAGTPSQTVGPYFEIGLSQLCFSSTYDEGAEGKPVIISGRIFDGDGVVIPDALLEFWQADSHGIYVGTNTSVDRAPDYKFRGFARIATDSQGGYTLRTILPGRTPGLGSAMQAPHLVVLIFFRGALRQLLTRMYFADEAANEEDLILKVVPHDRRHTLMAEPKEGEADVYLWDIHMQGDEETVFLAC